MPNCRSPRHFSFLRGASSPEELFAAAAMLGLPALGLPTAIRSPESCAPGMRSTTGVRSIVGCRLDLADGTGLLLYPTDRVAYGRLCRLLSDRQIPRRQGRLPPGLGAMSRIGTPG
jgi:error-prone DNA polymerase